MRIQNYIYFVSLVLMSALIVSCGMKKAPDEQKEEKSAKPRTGVVVYKSSTLGNEVYSLADSDATIRTSIVPSLSVYDYMDRVKETLGKESKINVDQNCFGIGAIGQTNPRALEIDIVVDQECASLPEGEASHTDPSPEDTASSWMICQPSDSGGVEDGPGTAPPGGGPGGNPTSTNSTGDNEGGSDQAEVVGSLQDILCGPAVLTNPGGVDPRLVYPDPNKGDFMVAELAPCIGKFCPWKLIPLPPDPEDDPTDPVDPNPEDDAELPDEIREMLPCDQFKGLCEPDITMIDKNDLVKGDDDDSDIDGDPEGTCDGKCDGVCEKKDGKKSPGESCQHGDVGNEDENYKTCGPTEVSKGSVCVKHTKEDGKDKYTVTHGNGVDGNRPSVEEQAKRESDARSIVDEYTGGDVNAGNCTQKMESNRDENKTTFTFICK